ncbi:hypothetical protein CD798_09440 [Bacillaceae bacterium SAOS 7]|nr:hypothetical protein CD798_09440 [Bacillaceae bacterium SAOS 7]
MKKNKVVNYVLAGALSFGILGGASLTALAATNSATTKPSAVESSKSVKAPLDSETQKQVETIMNKLKADLAELGVTMPEKGPKGSAFANLYISSQY